MLCCAGLFGGMAVGQSLGGPWTVVAPAAGFGLGLWADMKLMKRMHGKGHQQHEPPVHTEKIADPYREAEADGIKPPYRLPDPGKV